MELIIIVVVGLIAFAIWGIFFAKNNSNLAESLKGTNEIKKLENSFSELENNLKKKYPNAYEKMIK